MISETSLAEVIVSDPQALILTLFMVATRLGAAIWIGPLLGGYLVPRSVRLALVLALSFLVFPSLLASSRGTVLSNVTLAAAIAITIKEAIVGSAIGFIGGLAIWACESAGWLADTARGAALSETVVPGGRRRTTPNGAFLSYLALALFFSLGGHRIYLSVLLRTYEVLPITHLPPLSSLELFMLYLGRLSAEMIALAVAIAAPVLAVMLLIDLSLGWMNRLAPQLNSFFLGMPAKAIMGIVTLAIMIAPIIALLPGAIEIGIDHIGEAIRLLATSQ